MDLDDIEPIYLTPELIPATPAPNLITDDADMRFEAGRMLNQDTSKSNMSSNETNKQMISDDDTDNEDSEAQKRKVAVQKAIEKGARLDRN
jgi:hypothetical protein